MYGDGMQLGGGLLLPRPTRVIPHGPKFATRQSATNGGYANFSRRIGWWWELEWGSDVVDNESLVALKTIFDAIASPSGFTTFGYVGINNANPTLYEEFDVLFDEDVAAPIKWGSIGEKLVIKLYQVINID